MPNFNFTPIGEVQAEKPWRNWKRNSKLSIPPYSEWRDHYTSYWLTEQHISYI